MNISKHLWIIGAVVSMALAVPDPAAAALGQSAGKDQKLVRKVEDSHAILKEFLEGKDSQIPADLLKDAKAVMIFSDSVRAGLFVTGSFSQGIGLVKGKDGKWSAPAFFRMTGMGLGFQIGGDVTDLVLVMRDEQDMRHLLEHRFTMGADASAAAGEKGRQLKAEANQEAKMLTYGRSKGLFAGVSVDGNVIKQDEGANGNYYGRNYDAREILFDGKAPVTREAAELIKTLAKHS